VAQRWMQYGNWRRTSGFRCLTVWMALLINPMDLLMRL
jgi:hypothetical protein